MDLKLIDFNKYIYLIHMGILKYTKVTIDKKRSIRYRP